MPINKKLKAKIMQSVRKTYPRYSLARRLRIANAIIYKRLKK